MWKFLDDLVAGLHAFTAKGLGLTPGWGKIISIVIKSMCSVESNSLIPHGLQLTAGVQPRLLQGVQSGDGVGEDQDTIASIGY